VAISGTLPVDDGWTLRAGVGAVLDGTLRPDAGPAHTVEPGGLAAVGGEHRTRDADGATPSLDLTFLIGVTWAQTTVPTSGRRANYFAADVRAGVRAAWQLTGGIFPFAAARVFGGPVNWELDGEDVQGTDIHHYQLALGAAARLGKVGLFLEWAGLGERSLAVGLNSAW
jgi:hypothetical protein